jgi:hypothetical protein
MRHLKISGAIQVYIDCLSNLKRKLYKCNANIVVNQECL